MVLYSDLHRVYGFEKERKMKTAKYGVWKNGTVTEKFTALYEAINAFQKVSGKPRASIVAELRENGLVRYTTDKDEYIIFA